MFEGSYGGGDEETACVSFALLCEKGIIRSLLLPHRFFYFLFFFWLAFFTYPVGEEVKRGWLLVYS